MGDSSPFEGKPSTGTGGCKRTVVYNGKCVFAGSLNYMAFGKMNQLCHEKFSEQPFKGVFGLIYGWSLWDVVWAVTYQKNYQNKDFGCTAAQAFDYAALGYQGSIPWWATGIPITKQCPDCDTFDSRPVKETVFGVQWAKYRF